MKSRRPSYAIALLLDLIYIATLIVIVKADITFTALQIVGTCGLYITVNSLYGAYKKQLTFKHFMEYSAIGFLAAIIALSFLT